LTGRQAFPGTDGRKILEKNRKGDINYPQRFWNKISEAGLDLVKSMLEKDPDLRFSAQQ